MTFPPTVEVRWPAAKEYPARAGDWTSAWVEFKLDSAAWYINILEQLGGQLGYGRWAGVEMAIDGALSTLCGAYDAAHRALLAAAYDHRGLVLPPAHKGPRKDEYGPVLEQLIGPVADVHKAVKEATERRGDLPVGWLVKLKDLRNQPIHEHSAARFIQVETGGPNPGTTTMLAVPGEDQPQHPIDYLRSAHTEMTAICAELRAARLSLQYSVTVDQPGDRQSATLHGTSATATAAGIPGKFTIQEKKT